MHRFKNILNNSNQEILEEKVLSQWDLMWRKFKRNKLAVIGGIVIFVMYFVIFMGDFFTPYDMSEKHFSYITAPPQMIHIIDEDGLSRPYVHPLKMEMDLETMQRVYKVDKTQKNYVYFFIRNDYEYKLLGLFKTNLHLFDTKEGEVFIFGTDKFGRDMLARILMGGRVSLSIGLLGVTISILLGSTLGTISGYYGGIIDMIIQRIIEFLKSFPQIPLWMALAAALPPDWSSIKVYFGIVTILAFLGWTGLARAVRGKIIAYREEEYILAAKAAGSKNGWIIFRHLIPSALSHIIVVATLSVPGMILGEASLSFLGLGIKPPMTSWGVLLQEAQNVRTIAIHPWLFIPGIFIIVVILAFNFLGDGIRDAADPFSN